MEEKSLLFKKLFFKCYNVLINTKKLDNYLININEITKKNEENNFLKEYKQILTSQNLSDNLFDILSNHYKSSRAENYQSESTDIALSTSTHAEKRDLETSIYQCDENGISNKQICLALHWFYEDMARNLACSFENFTIDNKDNRILIIDDNLESGQLKERYLQVIEIIKYKLKEFNNNNNIDNLKADLLTTENNVKKLYEQLENLDKIKFEDDKNDNSNLKETFNLKVSKIQKNGTTDIENYRYIFVDLLVEEENIGLEIINRLRELQDYNPELKYEIIAVSRSTNTEDIQKALNFGASFYIPKERIFSIPHRIAQLGPEPPNFINTDKSFKSLAKLPRRIQKQLQTSYLSFDNKNDYNWINLLPKADIHVHLGGYMDAEITLKLSFHTALLSLLNYIIHDTFEIIDSNLSKLWNGLNGEMIDADNKKELQNLLQDIHIQAKIYRKYAEDLYKLSRIKSNTGNIEIEQELKNVRSPDKFFEYIADKYKHKFYGLKPFQVTSIFNVFLSKSTDNIPKIDNFNQKDLMNILNFELNKDDKKDGTKIVLTLDNSSEKIDVSSSKLTDNLTKLIQATHGHSIDKAVGGITLNSFLKGCDYTGSDVLQTKYAIREAVRYVCNKAMEDNVYYLSLRATPLNFCRGGLSEEEVWEAIKKGYNDFRKDIKNDNYFLILTIKIALKRHYKNIDIKNNIRFGLKYNWENQTKKDKDIQGNQMKKNNDVQYFDSKGLPTKDFYSILPFVSGFDLTGLEIDHNPQKFREEFKDIFKHCMPITIHAGEETPARYIWEAAYELNANRIGHGLSLPNQPELLEHFKDFGKCIELCPSSNYLTQEDFKIYTNNIKGFYNFGDGKKGRDYPLAKFLKDNLGIVICTDDPAVQNTDLSTEYLWASKMTCRKISGKYEKGITKWEVLSIIRNGFKYCFLPYDVKSKLLRTIDYKVNKLLK